MLIVFLLLLLEFIAEQYVLLGIYKLKNPFVKWLFILNVYIKRDCPALRKSAFGKVAWKIHKMIFPSVLFDY